MSLFKKIIAIGYTLPSLVVTFATLVKENVQKYNFFASVALAELPYFHIVLQIILKILVSQNVFYITTFRTMTNQSCKNENSH